MELVLFKAAKLILPSICICYSFCWSAVNHITPYHETYGSPDYLLDVYFDVNPRGFFHPGKPEYPVKFTGYFATEHGEEKVSGILVRNEGESAYVFESKEGRFEGQLVKRGGQCEPSMYFRLKNGLSIRTSGLLQGTYCE